MLAEELGFECIEWVIDSERLNENPIMTSTGQQEIRVLCKRHGVTVPAATSDHFMRSPYWKASGDIRSNRETVFMGVLRACVAAGIPSVMVPLVDEGRLAAPVEEEALIESLLGRTNEIAQLGLKITFESDYPPAELTRFIRRLEPDQFGLTYDIGDHASLGFDPREEIASYGDRILNVHVKDRLRGGGTVPLGEGDADFDKVFSALSKCGYDGNFILQTARDPAGNHVASLERYRDLTLNWMIRHGLSS